MRRHTDSVATRLVNALPLVCVSGAAAMAGLGWALRRRLTLIDQAAFALDAVGYAAAVVPTSRRHPAGWWILTVLTAAQPLFSLAKLSDGTGSHRELVGRGLATLGALAALTWVKPHYDRARLRDALIAG